jgi:uncharacterized protein (DUF1800 family)
MFRIVLCAICGLFGSTLWAQYTHPDFIGAGHHNGVTVTTSSNSDEVNGEATIDGFRIQNADQLKDASRFLAQASFGADFATIEMTAAMGYDAWLDEQFALPAISIRDEMIRIGYTGFEEEEEEEEEEVELGSFLFELAWTNNHLSSPDVLRQRMAFALSQIMVVNRSGDFFEDFGLFGGSYYDLLMRNSFGQYQELLNEVTLSMTMGLFLSHYNNRKADPALNIHPDENYAREIMQLFSIGLWELNPNGTRRRDSEGQFISTYTNADIKEFAQVFTGLSSPLINGFEMPYSEQYAAHAVSAAPMRMYEAYHDTSSKELLNGLVLPAGQSGMADIEQTITHLATHPNTAPFISRQLIQRFTTSNPSPQYVSEVASVFNPSAPNNFQTVLRTILLHPEARNCRPLDAPAFGKLREPILRVMNIMKSFQLASEESGDFFHELGCLQNTTGQFPLSAPSVFNFYRPDYSPQGPVNQNYLVAPEFQILNSTNVIGIINDVQYRTIFGAYSECEFGELSEIPNEEYIDYEYGEGDPEWLTYTQDYRGLAPLLDNPAALVDYLDILLANGLLEADTKRIIANAVAQLETPQERLRMALYLIFISPDYTILK